MRALLLDRRESGEKWMPTMRYCEREHILRDGERILNAFVGLLLACEGESDVTMLLC